MPFQKIIQHCSPTLAGIKVGNLFSIRFTEEDDLDADIKEKNDLLNPRGLYFRILKRSNLTGLALIYVYRKTKLEKVLQNKEIQNFLAEHEYIAFDLESVFATISKHFENSEFPHEIGVLLGYPLEDIKAFILNKGMNYKCVGIWKVYSNENLAKKTFEKYKKCKDVYCKKYKAGFDIMKLTVAG